MEVWNMGTWGVVGVIIVQGLLMLILVAISGDVIDAIFNSFHFRERRGKMKTEYVKTSLYLYASNLP